MKKLEGVNYKNKYLDFNSIIKSMIYLENEKIKNANLKRASPACIIYTSGTGGNPKGVILSHGGILNNIEGACEILKPLIDTNASFFNLAYLYHIPMSIPFSLYKLQ